MAKKVFTTIFIVIFVPIAIMAIILMNLRMTLLNSEFLKKGLVRADFYSQLVSKVLTSFVKTDGPNGSLALGPITQDEITSLINKALPSSALQSQIETSITNFNQFIASERSDLGVIINLGDAKKTLETELTKSLEKDWANLPDCSGAQTNSDELPTDCKPAGITASETVHNLLYKSNGGLFNNIPDNLNVQNNWVKNMSIFNPAKTIYHFVDLGGKISLVISLFLLLFIILLNLKPISALFKTSGVALIIPSALVLIGTAVFHVIFFAFAVANLKLGLPESLMPLNIALIKSIIGRYLVQTEIVSGILAGIAITLLILANYFYKKSGARIVQVQYQPRNMDSLPVRK